MTTFERKLRAALRRLGVDSDSSVVVAVSGGADSTALLDGLVRLRNEKGWPKTIFAAHLNHRLRGVESDGDENFVLQMAHRLNVEYFIDRIDVAQEAARRHENLEATARKLRYEFLRRSAETAHAEYVMTAHSRDDQAETVVMRLLRGSGMNGLRGIHPVRPLGGEISLLRPMLAISRAEVIEHCERHGLSWRTDSSNFSIDMTRNRVRHELMPLLRGFNPRIDVTLAREAELMREDAECLDALASGYLERSLLEGRLQTGNLISTHPAIRRRAFRLWLQLHGRGLGRLETAHIRAIDALLSPGKSGRTVELPGGWTVYREFNSLVLRQSSAAASPPPSGVHPSGPFIEGSPVIFGDFRLHLFRNVNQRTVNISRLRESGCFFILLKEMPSLNEILIRTRRPGDSYVPAGNRHRIKLKTLMIRHKIPFSVRDTYPVLVTSDDSIIWSPGMPAAAEYAALEDFAGPVILITAPDSDSERNQESGQWLK